MRVRAVLETSGKKVYWDTGSWEALVFQIVVVQGAGRLLWMLELCQEYLAITVGACTCHNVCVCVCVIRYIHVHLHMHACVHARDPASSNPYQFRRDLPRSRGSHHCLGKV